jgi:hypothetical protein
LYNKHALQYPRHGRYSGIFPCRISEGRITGLDADPAGLEFAGAFLSDSIKLLARRECMRITRLGEEKNEKIFPANDKNVEMTADFSRRKTRKTQRKCPFNYETCKMRESRQSRTKYELRYLKRKS